MHFVRQAVVSKSREKENTSKPAKMAPITLVAARMAYIVDNKRKKHKI